MTATQDVNFYFSSQASTGTLGLRTENEQELVAVSLVRVRLRPPVGPLGELLEKFGFKANYCVNMATGARGLGSVCLARKPWRQEAPPQEGGSPWKGPAEDGGMRRVAL